VAGFSPAGIAAQFVFPAAIMAVACHVFWIGFYSNGYARPRPIWLRNSGGKGGVAPAQEQT
jgi:hypothetical protein